MREMPPQRVTAASPEAGQDFGTNTTIGVIVTNARLDKAQCQLLAEGGHDGYARCLVPAHAAADGDAIVAAATGDIEADPIHLRVMATESISRAIRSLL